MIRPFFDATHRSNKVIDLCSIENYCYIVSFQSDTNQKMKTENFFMVDPKKWSKYLSVSSRYLDRYLDRYLIVLENRPFLVATKTTHPQN